MRNPSRTAQTAAALTIGVALVTGVTVFAASLNETFIGTLDKRVRADLVIISSSQQPFSPAAAAALEATRRSCRGVTAWRDGEFKDAGGRHPGRVGRRSRAARRELYDPGVTEGSMTSLRRAGTIAVQEDYAKDHDLTVGLDDAGALRQDRAHRRCASARSSPTTPSASSSSRCPSTSATSPPSRTR